MLVMNCLVVIRAILDTSVRMVDQSLAALTMPKRKLQGLADLLRAQAVMHVMTHDLSGIGIRDQAQVNKATVRRHIGDISHLDLFRCGGLNLRIPGLEQIGVALKPVVAVCRLVVRPLRGHQQV